LYLLASDTFLTSQYNMVIYMHNGSTAAIIGGNHVKSRLLHILKVFLFQIAQHSSQTDIRGQYIKLHATLK
jgi:hypothetical protein